MLCKSCERLDLLNKTALVLLAAAITALAARPSFTTADIWAWRSAEDPRISSDGAWVVYVEEWNDRPATLLLQPVGTLDEW